MNNTTFSLVACLMVVFALSMGVLGSAVYHNEVILVDAYNEVELQYFIESNDDMNSSEKYLLIQSLCNQAFNNESLYEKMWFGSIEDQTIQINTCERILLKTEGSVSD